MKKRFGGSSVRRIHSVGGGVRPGPSRQQAAPDGWACRARSGSLDEARSTGFAYVLGRAGPGVRRRQMPARLRGGHGAPAGQQHRVRRWFATRRRRTRTRSCLPREGPQRRKRAGRFWRMRRRRWTGSASSSRAGCRQIFQTPGRRAAGTHLCTVWMHRSRALRKAKRSPASTGAPLRSIRTMPPGSTPMKRSTG